MKQPKISIITPCYNSAIYIEEAILSVLEQGYPNLEYIIVDGGSTDGTIQVIKKYEKYLKWWTSEPDSGQSDAIRKGASHASGEVINWLNSDDYYTPNALYIVGESFSDPRVMTYCGRSRIFGSNNELFSSGTDVYINNLEKTIGMARIDQPGTFFRKKRWDELGGLDCRYQYLMDREFWIRYLLRYGLNGIRKTSDLLVNFCLHQNSKTVSQKSGFIHEGTSLFSSLAAALGYFNLSQLSSDCNKLSPFFPFVHAYGDVESIFNYFFFGQLIEAYAANQFDDVLRLSHGLNPELLDRADKTNYQSIIRKAKYLPIWAKILWNRLHS